MPRSIPAIQRANLEQVSGGETLIVFVTITHPDTASVIRLVNDGVDYVRDGETFNRAGFELNMPDDTSQYPVCEFSFQNVDREAVTRLKDVHEPAVVLIELVSTSYFDLTADPRTVLATSPATVVVPALTAADLYLVNVDISALEVRGQLRRMDPSTEAWPNVIVTQALLPGVFAR